MPITEEEFDPGAPAVGPEVMPQEADAAVALKKKIYIGFSGTVVISLALAGLYIGGRVYAAHKPSVAPIANVTASAEVTSKAPAARPPAPVLARPKPSPVIQPAAAAPPLPASSPASAMTAPSNGNSDPRVSATPAAAGQPLRTLVKPQPNEMYLQLAALGPKALDRYLPEVEAQGLHPLVAPGPDATLFRVLIGPYPNRDEMGKVGKELESKGIESMPRTY